MSDEDDFGMFWWYDILEEENMIKCSDCGKEIHEDSVVYCEMCGTPLCRECGTTGLCSTCTELWESEIDLEDMEAEEE